MNEQKDISIRGKTRKELDKESDSIKREVNKVIHIFRKYDLEIEKDEKREEKELKEG